MFIRQSMKDTSGATVMDPATQVTSLHGDLDARRREGAVRGQPVPGRPARAERPQRQQARQRRDRGPRQPARRSDPGRRRRRPRGRQRAQRRARGGRQHPGAAPGRRRPARGRDAARAVPAPGQGPAGREARLRRDCRPSRRWSAPAPDPRAAAMLAALEARGARSVFVRYLRTLGENVTADAVLGGRGPDPRLGAAAAQAHQPAHRAQPALVPGALRHADRRRGARRAARGGQLLRRAQRRAAPRLDRDRAGGPGAHRPPAGRGGAVLLSGPARAPARPTARARSRRRAPRARSPPTAPRRPSGCRSTRRWSGFLTHTGFSHGGNGFEGMQLLLERVRATPRRAIRASPSHGLDLAAMATRLRPGLQAGEDAASRGRGRGRARHPGRQPPGVPRQAGQHRPARGVRRAS